MLSHKDPHSGSVSLMKQHNVLPAASVVTW